MRGRLFAFVVFGGLLAPLLLLFTSCSPVGSLEDSMFLQPYFKQKRRGRVSLFMLRWNMKGVVNCLFDGFKKPPPCVRLLDITPGGDWSNTDFEREVYDDLAQELTERGVRLAENATLCIDGGYIWLEDFIRVSVRLYLCSSKEVLKMCVARVGVSYD